MSEPVEIGRRVTGNVSDLVQGRTIQRSDDLQKRLQEAWGQRGKTWALEQAAKKVEPTVPGAEQVGNGRLAMASQSVLSISAGADLQKRLQEAWGQREKTRALEQAAKKVEPTVPGAERVGNGRLAMASQPVSSISVGRELTHSVPLHQLPPADVRSADASGSPIPLLDSELPARRLPWALGLVFALVSGSALVVGLHWLDGVAPLRLPDAVDAPGLSAGLASRTSDNITVPTVVSQSPPRPLADLSSSEALPIPASSSSPVFRPPTVETLISPPSADELPVLKVNPEAGGVPLALTDVFQTSAREPEAAQPKVVLHLSSDMSDAAREETQSVLRSEGFDLASSNLASFRVAESQVFFFHQEDASSAARVAETIGGRVRDFSSFRPAPERGRLEVWLAQDE